MFANYNIADLFGGIVQILDYYFSKLSVSLAPLNILYKTHFILGLLLHY